MTKMADRIAGDITEATGATDVRVKRHNNDLYLSLVRFSSPKGRNALVSALTLFWVRKVWLEYEGGMRWEATIEAVLPDAQDEAQS